MRSVQPVYDGTDLPNIDPVQAVMDYAERQGWSLDELNKHLVRYILCKHLGARSRVSKLLGINPRTLRSRIHRWKLVTK